MISIFAAFAAVISFASCSSTGNLASAKTFKVHKNGNVDGAKSYVVKTTAYSHLEGDSLKYGTKNAAGGNLKYGLVRSAAAD